jgi:chromosome segregation ATPase
MTDQPEALRLAECLDEPLYLMHGQAHQAAAELRRLHAENERLHQINHAHEMKLSVRGYEIQIEDLRLAHAELRERNAELLEALKNLEKEFRKVYPIYYYAEPWGHETNVPLQAARAAIAKAEGGQG